MASEHVVQHKTLIGEYSAAKEIPRRISFNLYQKDVGFRATQLGRNGW